MMSLWSLACGVGPLSVAYLTGTLEFTEGRGMTVRFAVGPVMLCLQRVMLFGLLLTPLFPSSVAYFIGMLLFSAGFFAAHSVASS